MQNWFTKAPSGGLQQHYPRGGEEQLQITKPMCETNVSIPLKILEKVALQDYPGTEPYRNGPCIKDEKQIIAGSYSFGSTRTGQRWGKSSRENIPCSLASAKPQSHFCSCPFLGSEALWCSPCRVVWAFSFLPPVSLGKLIWDTPSLISKPLKNLPHFLANWWALFLKWSRATVELWPFPVPAAAQPRLHCCRAEPLGFAMDTRLLQQQQMKHPP